MALFGIRPKNIVKSITDQNIKKLDLYQKRWARKPTDRINLLLDKTIEDLGENLKDTHKQTLFIGFALDLYPIESQKEITHLFKKNIFKASCIKDAFLSAMFSHNNLRAIKLIMIEPKLLVEKVKNNQRAYEFLNEKDLTLLLNSGVINENFLISLLPEDG